MTTLLLSLSTFKPSWNIHHPPTPSLLFPSFEHRALWYYRLSLVLELCVSIDHHTRVYFSSDINSYHSDPHTLYRHSSNRQSTTSTPHGAVLASTITATIRFLLPISLTTSDAHGRLSPRPHLLADVVQQSRPHECHSR